jgi:hypothetical protein
MALFNQAHLKEVRDMTDGLEALRRRGPLEQWEIRSLKIWYRAHYLWTSRRFQVTRSYSMPRWEERIIFPVIVKQAQDEFQNDLHRLAYIIDRLEEGDSIEDQLLDAWNDYADHLELSMKLNTDIAMMLVYSYFSYEDHTAILAESELMMKTIQHTHAIGSAIGYCGVETFRETIMQREASHVGVSWDGFYKEVSWDNGCMVQYCVASNGFYISPLPSSFFSRSVHDIPAPHHPLTTLSRLHLFSAGKTT